MHTLPKLVNVGLRCQYMCTRLVVDIWHVFMLCGERIIQRVRRSHRMVLSEGSVLFHECMKNYNVLLVRKRCLVNDGEEFLDLVQ